MLKYLWITLSVVVVDQVTKYLVYSNMIVDIQRINILPVFDLTYRHNPGVAFGFMASHGGAAWWFLVLLTFGLSVVLLVWLYRMQAWEKLQAIAVAMILGGALGNLTDRFMHTDFANNKGGVVDFLLFYWDGHHFPAFNIADSAITMGVIVIFWFMLFVKEPDKAQDINPPSVDSGVAEDGELPEKCLENSRYFDTSSPRSKQKDNS